LERPEIVGFEDVSLTPLLQNTTRSLAGNLQLVDPGLGRVDQPVNAVEPKNGTIQFLLLTNCGQMYIFNVGGVFSRKEIMMLFSLSRDNRARIVLSPSFGKKVSEGYFFARFARFV